MISVIMTQEKQTNSQQSIQVILKEAHVRFTAGHSPERISSDTIPHFFNNQKHFPLQGPTNQ